MITFKQVNIDNRPRYFFDDIVNTKHFDPNLLSIDKISFNSTDAVIYNIKYIAMKSINKINIDSESPTYLIFDNVDGYNEESNGDKYLVSASTDKNKEILTKYIKIWDEIKNHIKKINVVDQLNIKEIS